MDSSIREYLSQIGRQGGLKSRRKLAAEDAKSMVKVREARRAFRKFYSRCFWSYDSKYLVTSKEVSWVSEQLMKYGDRKAWEVGARLCR